MVVTDAMRNRKSYDGATEKFGITVDGIDYIVKFAPTGLTSELYSEHVGSTFICNLGVPCQETALGYYNGRLVVILKDFVSAETNMRTFKHAMQSSGGLELAYENYTLPIIMSIIMKSNHMPLEVREAIANRFWVMLVCDAIIGNDDRHWGNWGYMYTRTGYAPAPIFDNGRSLYYDLDVQVQAYVRDKYGFLESRTYRHPSPKIVSSKRKNKKLNYNTLMADPEVRERVKPFLNTLSLEVVLKAITDACVDVPEPYRDFYIRLVCVRYLRIIERKDMRTAYDMICEEIGE